MTYSTRSNKDYQRTRAYDLLRRIEESLPSMRYERAPRAMYSAPAPGAYARRTLMLGSSPGWVRFSPDYALGGFWKEVGGRVEFIPHESAAGETIGEAFALLGLRVPRRPTGAS